MLAGLKIKGSQAFTCARIQQRLGHAQHRACQVDQAAHGGIVQVQLVRQFGHGTLLGFTGHGIQSRQHQGIHEQRRAGFFVFDGLDGFAHLGFICIKSGLQDAGLHIGQPGRLEQQAKQAALVCPQRGLAEQQHGQQSEILVPHMLVGFGQHMRIRQRCLLFAQGQQGRQEFFGLHSGCS